MFTNRQGSENRFEDIPHPATIRALACDSPDIDMSAAEMSRSSLKHAFTAEPMEEHRPDDNVSSAGLQPEGKPPFRERLREGIREGLNYLNPAYHFREIKQDIAAVREASRLANFENIKTEKAKISRLLYGRLTAALAFSEAMDWVGMPTGFIAQLGSGNPWVGFAAAWLSGYAAAVIGFQAAWFASNRDVYKASYNSVWKGLLEMEKDLWPVHKNALKISVPWFIASAALNGSVIAGVKHWAGEMIRYVPVGPLAGTLEIVGFTLLYLRIMGDFDRKYAGKLADKYVRSKRRD